MLRRVRDTPLGMQSIPAQAAGFLDFCHTNLKTDLRMMELNPKLQLNRHLIDQITIVSLYTLCSKLDNFTKENLDYLTKLSNKYSSKNFNFKYQIIFILFNFANCCFCYHKTESMNPNPSANLYSKQWNGLAELCN
eukprot:Mrub_04686.p3 GENE.Mrub_04686~~Mrub_04686.p3  ORF type:complete len:136 (+),score=14.76 Mrub_04686:222-629(+)